MPRVVSPLRTASHLRSAKVVLILFTLLSLILFLRWEPYPAYRWVITSFIALSWLPFQWYGSLWLAARANLFLIATNGLLAIHFGFSPLFITCLLFPVSELTLEASREPGTSTTLRVVLCSLVFIESILLISLLPGELLVKAAFCATLAGALLSGERRSRSKKAWQPIYGYGILLLFLTLLMGAAAYLTAE